MEHSQNKDIYCSVDKILVTRGFQKPNPVFPLEAMFQYMLI